MDAHDATPDIGLHERGTRAIKQIRRPSLTLSSLTEDVAAAMDKQTLKPAPSPFNGEHFSGECKQDESHENQ
jgi:hypothetical protein